MKNKIFNLFKEYFIEQIKAFALSNFPLQHTTQVTEIKHEFFIIKIKKGKIRETRIYSDKSLKQIKKIEIEPSKTENCLTKVIYQEINQ